MTKRRIYELRREPTGRTYEHLIEFSRKYCDRFILGTNRTA